MLNLLTILWFCMLRLADAVHFRQLLDPSLIEAHQNYQRLYVTCGRWPSGFG